ncbi:PHP domain-containing protein [Geomonas anaerohicana]|uniref:PHP domain-containing protein n=1 Tax=Geomonas anaerohicana TaxID=2798583 RepID=A0ABS0YCP0_9BACT|nr:PHP domain-containing protein [Geomonas anaerohicana]MBJ6750093.1 PHP domain-containing protein [Geomonas anaerohicana]
MRELVDLHLHSTFSDGVRTPTELVAMAKGLGLKSIALADHDTVDGIDEALAAGAAAGVEVLPALEFSVAYSSFKDVHLLGYLLDHRDAQLQLILKEFRDRREARGEAIVGRINEKLAIEGRAPISSAEAAALAGGALGRPHIAQVLMGKGYARDMQDAFVRYLLPCDVPKRYFPMEEALATVQRLGGVAVLAHPTTITNDRDTLNRIIDELCAMGLAGVEAFNNVCNEQESAFLVSSAEKKGLIWTGGSDYHGIEEGINMGTGKGSMAIPYSCVEALKRAQKQRA